MEEIITLKEGTEENPVLIVTTQVTKEIPLETLKRQRTVLATQKSTIDKRISDLDATISKGEEVISSTTQNK